MGRALPVISYHGDAQIQLGGLSAVSIPRSNLSSAINLAAKGEDFTWDYHFAGPAAAKTGNTKKALIDGALITLSEFTTSAAGGAGYLETRLFEAGLTPFRVGSKYLVSIYVYSEKDFWWNPRLLDSTGYGHGHVWVRAGEVTRVWYMVCATSTSKVDKNSNPLIAFGAGTGASISLVWHCFGPNLDVWIGGLMIEPVPDSYKDGIVLIGDSTMAGASGKKDYSKDFTIVNNREVSTVLGSELRVPVYNRAVGGERLDQMDARWNADISPLASRCHTAVIQGGINDLNAARTLTQMQASVLSMRDKAISDGFDDVRVLTMTPSADTESTSSKNNLRIQFNSWVKEHFGAMACDIAPLVTNEAGNGLNGAYGDGTHYPGAAKTAIGAYIASSMDWSWIKMPSSYIRV